MIVNGKTASGFEFAIDDNVVKSHRFARYATTLSSAGKGGRDQAPAAQALIGLELTLLGEGGIEALEDHLTKINGHEATIEEVASEIGEIAVTLQKESAVVKKS